MADISPAVGEYVEGVLCEIHPDDVEHLRKAEGVYIRASEEKGVFVETPEGQRVSCIVYVVVNKSGPYLPSRQYMSKLIEGAKTHGVSGESVDMLKAIDTK